MPKLQYTIAAHETYATVYSNGVPIGTIARPYVAQHMRNAVEHGDQWRVYDLQGRVVLTRNMRPTTASIARVLMDPCAVYAHAQ